jgi:hypothetical protein
MATKALKTQSTKGPKAKLRAKASRDKRKLLAIDKKYIAIHEAGHAVVGFALGSQFAELSLFLRSSLNSDWGHQGKASYIPPRSKLKAAARGYAGVIAEMLYDDLNLSVSRIPILIALARYEPSEPDQSRYKDLTPRMQFKAMKLALDTLRMHWQAVRSVAFELYESSDGNVVIGPMALEQKFWRGLL